MKPTTPQEFARCYGTFVADLNVVAKVLPNVSSWFNTALPSASSIYKLNSFIFSSYRASITSFPSQPRVPKEKEALQAYGKFDAPEYNKKVNEVWTAITIDLSNALSCAEVNPSEAAKILASFEKLKPAKASAK